MKKIFIYFPLIAVAVLACSKLEKEQIQKNVEPVSDIKMITEKVSGTSNPSSSSKVAIASNGSFSWIIGDNIAVHVSNGDSHMYVFTSGEGGASATAASAYFDVVYPDGYSRDAFAVYPSTIISNCPTSNDYYGQSGTPLNVTLPASYTLAELSGTKTPCPMIATNTAGSGWTFYQLCGLLRLTVNNIPPSTKRLEIDFDGKKVSGDFSIPSTVTPNSSVIATSNDPSHDLITVTKDGSDVTINNNTWLDGLVLNIPLPTGTYSNITVTTYDALTGGNVTLTMTSEFSYTASLGHGKKKTVSFPGIFSIGVNKRVKFAPGNLRATYNTSSKTWTWSFAPHQYDYIGNGSGNTNIITDVKENSDPYAKLGANGTVDLFGRSTSKTYYGIAKSHTDGEYSGNFVDWGEIDIDGNGPNYWRTLSEPEWQYVIGETTYRQNGGTITWSSGSTTYSVINALCAKAYVNSKKGLILFPDNFSGITPSGVYLDADAISPGGMVNSSTTGWRVSVTSSAWEVLENEGCVFLPAAGFRIFYNNQDNVVANVSGDGQGGYYLSRDHTILRFNNNGFDPNNPMTSYYYAWRSVRLVHVIE